MPFRRRNTRRPRRRRRTTRFRRTRRKNNYNRTSIPGTIMGNTLYTTLNISYPMFQGVIDGSNQNRWTSYSLAGNTLNPFGSATGPSRVGFLSVEVGNPLWNGLQAYAQFFNKVCILSSSIAFTIMPNDILDDNNPPQLSKPNLQVLGGAFNYNLNPGGASPTSLDQLSNVVLASQKGMKRRMITGLGGRNFAKIRMRRGTRHMLGTGRSVTDNNSRRCDIAPSLDTSVLANPTADNQWFYYFRVLQPVPSLDSAFTIGINMTCNVLFSDRSMWITPAAGNPAPPGEPV